MRSAKGFRGSTELVSASLEFSTDRALSDYLMKRIDKEERMIQNFSDFCAELLKRLKEHGIHTAVDTCGFVSRETLDRVIPFTDVFLYDIKAYDEEVHKKCTGVSNHRILDNLAYLDSVGKSVEIRIPYVPDHNDAEMRDIARFISTLKNVTKIRVLPYHAYAGSKYRALDMENTLPERLPSSTELDEAKAIIRRLTSVRVQD